jgi:hypothetical protein
VCGLDGRSDYREHDYVSDLDCYESALLDANGATPVERYTSKRAATAGHKRRVTLARSGDGKTVAELGYPGLLKPTIVMLRAMKKAPVEF